MLSNHVEYFDMERDQALDGVGKNDIDEKRVFADTTIRLLCYWLRD